MQARGLDRKLIELLRHMLPLEYRLSGTGTEKEEEFSETTMSEGARFFIGGIGGDIFDGKKIVHPLDTVLRFLHPDMYPIICFAEEQEQDEEQGKKQDEEKCRAERESALETFFTEKEREVDRFLGNFEPRLLAAATVTERALLLSQFISVTHLPPEFLDYLYQRTLHRKSSLDFPDFYEVAREKVDSNFCYRFAGDFLRTMLLFGEPEQKMKNPVLNIDPEILRGFLFEGAKEALRKQKELYSMAADDRIMFMFHGTLLDPITGERDLFQEARDGLQMLAHAESLCSSRKGKSKENAEQQEIQALFHGYKEFFRSTVDILCQTKYPIYYAYACYKTGDAEGLRKLAESYLSALWKPEPWADEERCQQADETNLRILKYLAISWNAAKIIDAEKGMDRNHVGDTTTDESAGLERRITEVLEAAKKDIRERILPELVRKEVSMAEFAGNGLGVRDLSTIGFYGASDLFELVNVLGDFELDKDVVSALIQYPDYTALAVCAPAILWKSFSDTNYEQDIFSGPETQLERLTFPKNTLEYEELRRRRKEILDIVRTKTVETPLLEFLREAQLGRFLDFEEIQEERAEEALRKGDLLSLRRCWRAIGKEDEAYRVALQIITNIEDEPVNEHYCVNQALLTSLLGFYEEGIPAFRNIPGRLQEIISRAIQAETGRQEKRRGKVVDHEVFHSYMTVGAKLGLTRVLNEGARWLIAGDVSLYNWFREYWPVEAAEELDSNVREVLEREAAVFMF
jgi:hypothetical protein